MLKKRLITLGIVSWALFTIINLVMSSSFVALSQSVQLSAVIGSVVTSLILYGLPMIWGALGHNSGYYILAVVIVVYSFGLFNGMVTVLTASHAVLGIRLLMAILNLAVIVFNIYWLLLALRYRHWLDNRRDNAKLQQIKQQQENQKNNRG